MHTFRIPSKLPSETECWSTGLKAAAEQARLEGEPPEALRKLYGYGWHLHPTKPRICRVAASRWRKYGECIRAIAAVGDGNVARCTIRAFHPGADVRTSRLNAVAVSVTRCQHEVALPITLLLLLQIRLQLLKLVLKLLPKVLLLLRPAAGDLRRRRWQRRAAFVRVWRKDER